MTTPSCAVADCGRPAALWTAVDTITQERRVRVMRAEERAVLAEIAAGGGYACSVAAWRYATSSHATVPSLWEQAQMALTTGAESTGGKPSAVAHRSPADLDLMDIMATVREVIGLQLAGRRLEPRPTVPLQIRQLAAHVGSREPAHVEWWTFRLAQWGRLLGVYLHAVETGPKPLRLRNAACPLCKTRTVTVEVNGEPVVAPALLVDFRDGYIRAAQCSACAATWWRGDQLLELADALDTPTVQVAADTAS